MAPFFPQCAYATPSAALAAALAQPSMGPQTTTERVAAAAHVALGDAFSALGCLAAANAGGMASLDVAAQLREARACYARGAGIHAAAGDAVAAAAATSRSAALPDAVADDGSDDASAAASPRRGGGGVRDTCAPPGQRSIARAHR